MKKEPDLNLEEIIFKGKEGEYLELPLSKNAFFLVFILSVLIIFIVFGRLIFLNVLNGGFYQARASANINKEINLPAYRGIIVDRSGKILVKNSNAFSVFLNINDFLKNSTQFELVVENLSTILNLDQNELKEKILKFDLEKENLLKIARNISLNQIRALRELNLPFIEIEDDYSREYWNGPVFSHILGYVGIGDKKNSLVGKSGLEAFYDGFLRGEDGKYIVYRDAKGKILDEKTIRQPRAGYRLESTIDSEFQEFFYKALLRRLQILGKQAGVGIALNPQNGEILSLISLPSFDNNLFSFDSLNEERLKILKSPLKPLFNRAISGLYVPGSTIKPLVALAALKEKIINPNFQIYSPGYIEISNPYNPETPSRFLDWKAHGWVDLYSALARSSNVYFYAIGGGFENIKGLGIQKLNEYWQKFGFNKKTGIDLPFEGVGYLSNPREKEKRKGDIWRIGDTYNVSIGQGDILITPIQLISFIGSIANNGKIYKPHLIKRVLNEEGNVIFEAKPEELIDYSDWISEIKEIQIGMRDAVQRSYGTAHLLNDLPFPVAGKTGTAQVFGKAKNNAFFVGYLPTKSLAILILIEDVPKEGGHNAVPVAKEVLEWYYNNR